MKKILVLCMFALLTASCVPEFKEGLPTSATPKIDKQLLGKWYGKAGDHIEWFIVSDKGNGYIEINEYSETGEPHYVPLRAYTSNIKDEKFLSALFCEPNTPVTDCNNYSIVNYKIHKSTLYVNVFSLNKVQHLIETGVLKGEIKSGFPFNSVKVISSGKYVAKAIKENGVTAFIDPNITIMLTREKQDANSSSKRR